MFPLFFAKLDVPIFSMTYTRYFLEKELVCLSSTTKKHTNSIIQPKHEGKHLHLPHECSPNPLGFRSTDTVGHRDMICFGSMFVMLRRFLLQFFLKGFIPNHMQNWGGGEDGENLSHPFPFLTFGLGLGMILIDFH